LYYNQVTILNVVSVKYQQSGVCFFTNHMRICLYIKTN